MKTTDDCIDCKKSIGTRLIQKEAEKCIKCDIESFFMVRN